MAGKRKYPLWRQTFLGALARTGNVRAAAFEAGIDPGTAYDHRIKDAGFAAQWDAALAKALQPRPGEAPKDVPRFGSGRTNSGGRELVVRRTRHGDQMVRAGAGRWCARTESAFFAALGRTACVRASAAEAGISTTALYKRRGAYPEFAERWRAVEAEAAARLPGLLHAAGIASLDPDIARRGLPKVNVDQAIAISKLKAPAAAGARPGRAALLRREKMAKEDLTKALLKLLGALGKRRREARLAEGWTEAEGDVWVPPGWVRAPGEA